MMRFGWVGFHLEGVPALRAVLEKWYPVVSVISLTPEAAASRSGARDYSAICNEFDVPLHLVPNINNPEAVDLLRELDLDVLFVIGWSQILRAPALRTASRGVIGAHASLLPADRGRAPINWALIRGAHETGSSLMWLAEGVDVGDLIDQRTIPITPYDTCESLYEKVAVANRDMILSVIPHLLAGEHPGVPQPHVDAPLLPGRRPEDGRVDWMASHDRVYDFIRALTRPYPGAFSTLDGERLFIWDAALLPDGLAPNGAAPGSVIGSVVSPREDACGQAVACGTGAVVLLDLEDVEGHRLRGRALSDRPWKGKVWTT